MDLIIKAKAFELEALQFLDKRVPEMYKGKKHGFYWAVHEAQLSREEINWIKVAKVRLEDLFSGKSYEYKAPVVTHLTADADDYGSLAHIMEQQFNLKRPIQKAYCARNVIKWAITRYYSGDMIATQQSNATSGEFDGFSSLTLEEKVNVLYREIIEVKKMLLTKKEI